MMYSRHGAKLLRHLLAVLLCAVGAAAAQESVPPSTPPPALRFRRVFVPQADLDQFTRGYLPLRRDEFPGLLNGVERRLQGSRDDAAWIQSADYSAVFTDGHLAAGLATLNVVHTATEPSLLLLSQCQLAMGVATWHGAETVQDAIVGNDLAGNLVAVVHESGQLQFPWTLRGNTNEWDGTTFDVVLPPAPMSRLTVDLPARYQLLSDRGIVSQMDRDPNDPSDLTQGSQRWFVQLGGAHRFQLTVASESVLRQRRQLVSLQQDTRYRLADDGLEVDCNVELEIQREPLEVLLFRVDPELQVTAVRLGNRDVAWSLASEPDGRSRQLQIRFSEPLSGIHRTLQLSAIGPLLTDTMWQLPRFHPQDTQWRQGTMALMLPDSLGLRHLATHFAQQSEATSSETTSPMAARRFELFSSDGYLEVNVVRTLHQLSGTIGTTIDLEPGTMTARIVADLTCTSGQHYVLEADVPNTWTLEGIESEPANALENHRFVAYETEYKRLQIRLAQPLTTDQPLRLTFRAHRTATPTLQADDFRPLRLSRLAQVTQLVAIAPDPTFHLDVSGDVEVERQDPDNLPPAELELLQPRSGGIIFLDDRRADAMTVRVTHEDPTFTTENHVRVEFTADSLTESYRLICKPESTSVNRLLVLLSQPRTEPIRWSMDADGNELLNATKLTEPQDRSARFNQTGELWELLLRNPQDKPFEIHGTRTTAFTTAVQISLATLPDATSQEGWLSIESLDGTTMSLKTSSVKPIPCIPPKPEQCATPQARYRYDVSRNAQVLVDHIQPRTVQAPLWAWQCLLHTQLFASGETTHWATYLLESAGGSEFQFRLPTDCTLLNVEVDGVHVARPVHTKENRSYTVAVPAQTRFPRVTVAYSAPKHDFQLFQRMAAQLPDIDVPVLDRQWTLWLAPGLDPAPQLTRFDKAPAPTWSQRLLGPLAANSSQQPFRLFSAEQWESLADRSSQTRRANGYAHRFLQLLGERYLALQTQTSIQSVTWRDLLTDYQQYADRQPDLQVWIDSARFAEHEFTLEQAIEVLKPAAPIQVASEVLSREELVVVSHNNIVLLTTLDGLARVPTSIQATDNSALATVLANSPLAHDLESLGQVPLNTIIPLASWIAQPTVARLPWKGRHDISRSGVADRYWRACEVHLTPGGEGGLTVLRTPTLEALGWALLLTSTGLICWLGSYRPRWVLLIIFGAALLAMLVPSTWIPLTANILLGTVLAGLMLAVRHLATVSRPVAEPPHHEPDAVNVAARVGLCLLALLFAVGTRELPAQETQQAPTSDDTSQIYRVIVPVDEDFKPVGDYDYLPTDFYDRIHRRAGESAASAQHWLVRRATYRAIFNWTRQRSSLDLTSFTAVYQLQLFRPLQRIEFPWNGGDPAVQILEARLAGQPIELIWNRDHTAFFVTVPSEGFTQLEFVLLPATYELEGARNLQFPIPPLSQSQLRIETPFDAPDVEVRSAIGETEIIAETGERLVELGPVRSMALRWASSAASSIKTRQLDVQQLNWIKVRPKDHPDSVILDTKLRIRASGGPISQVSLQIDSRLRLLPVPAKQDVEIDESGLRNGNQSPLVVRLREPTDTDLTLHLQFWVMNSTGFGNLSLPRLEVVDGQVERRWLAVSVASELDFSVGLSESFTPMDAAEFLTVWGEAELAPSLCYRMEAEDPMWSISTRAREPRSETRQQLDISVGRSAMKLVFNADIDTTSGTVFQHALSVPRGFRVSQLLVTSSGEPVAADAQHDGSGILTLFLGQGVTGPHHVELRGEMELQGLDSDIPVPEITLHNATATSSLVRIYRQVNVLVSIKNPVQPDLAQRAGLGRFREAFGRLVAMFEASGDRVDGPETVALQVHPNQPSVRARLVTTLRRVDDTWEAIADYEARVTNAPAGVADQFRFEIPEEWTEPLTVEPAMPYEIRPIPGQRRHLILLPTEAVTQRFQVRIRGILGLEVNERGRSPNIVPLDVTRADRFVVLPTQLDQQRIDWETSGLHLVPLQEAIPNARPEDARGEVAYAVYARPRAVIADIQRAVGERQIGLADVHLMCQADGSCLGMIAFEMAPAGVGNCTLEVPNHCELIEATVEGVPATLVPLADRRWNLRLASEQLPQQLTVLFRTELPTALSATAQQVPLPTITDFDVVRTLWTVHGPRTLVLEGDSLEQHQVTAVAQEAIRLRSTASLVESAVESVLDSSATEVKAWYTPWAIRLACCDARLTRERQRANGQSLMTADAVAALNRQQTIISQRLGVSPTVEDFRQQTSRYPQPNDMLRFLQRGNLVTQHYAFIGKAPLVSIAQQTSHLPTWWQQVLGAAAVTLLGGLVWLGIRNQRVQNWLCQWPYFLGILAGLAWWLFASPSLLGWAIVAVSLWGALRLPMPSLPIRKAAAESPAETAG